MPVTRRRGPRDIQFVINKNSVIDAFGQGYGRGLVSLDADTAEYFHKKGYGTYTSSKDIPVKRKAKVEPAPAIESQTEAKRAIPKDFPEYAKLKEAGFTSIEDLQVEGAVEEIASIKGIGKAAMTKIGLALEQYS